MWAQLEKSLFSRYHGVQGGVLLKGRMWEQVGQKHPWFAKVNNALWAAPAFKWGLAIVPLYGIVQGKPAVQDLDLNQSLALAATGLVWSYYGFLVVPRADLLIAVNVALLAVNGYNVARRIRYDQQHAPASQVSKV